MYASEVFVRCCRLLFFPRAPPQINEHLSHSSKASDRFRATGLSCCLRHMYTGAFIPGVPVQPMLLRISHDVVDPSWCGRILCR